LASLYHHYSSELLLALVERLALVCLPVIRIVAIASLGTDGVTEPGTAAWLPAPGDRRLMAEAAAA
jgi:hypothetical protein